MRALLLFLALTACAAQTTKQRLYEALGGYRAVAESAADYVEGPTADPAIVRRIATVTKSPEVDSALSYARAYVACQGKAVGAVQGFNCTLFNFSDANARDYAIVLRSAILKLRTQP